VSGAALLDNSVAVARSCTRAFWPFPFRFADRNRTGDVQMPSLMSHPLFLFIVSFVAMSIGAYAGAMLAQR
jgi:hypothetical protein